MNKPLFIETIKVKDGIFYNLPLHINRLQRTAKYFYKTTPQLLLTCEMIPPQWQISLLKCKVVYNHAIVSILFEKYTFRKIESLRLVSANDIEYNYKYEDRSQLNELLPQKNKTQEVLIVQNGQITDTSFSNVVFENTQGLYTPRHCLLRGVKRERLLAQGIIQEAEIEPKDVSSYNKLYLINALIDLEDDISIPIENIY